MDPEEIGAEKNGASENGAGENPSEDRAVSGDERRRLADSTSSAIEAARSASPMPFENLEAPAPIDSSPPEPARWLAFAGVLVGGLLGGLIGYGVGDLMGGTDVWSAIGALIGGVGGAVGVGIIAQLTLRAMGEWNAVHHPEATEPAKKR